MEEVVKAKGLPLIILIRLCPIPWVYNNAFFASIESVSLPQFILATIVLMPKLFLVVFIGAQVGELSDGETRGKLSGTAKFLDVLSIVFGVAVAAGTGWFVWRTTAEKIRSMEGLSDDIDRLAADALEDATAPLLHALSSSESLALSETSGYGHGRADGLDGVLDKMRDPSPSSGLDMV